MNCIYRNIIIIFTIALGCYLVVSPSAYSLTTNNLINDQMKKKDLTAQTFGRLTVVKEVEPHFYPSGKARTQYECLCECGKVVIVRSNDLVNKTTTSCGCYRKELMSKTKTTHGFTKTNKKTHPLYSIWATIKQRCTNENNKSYKDYGERGVSICNEWVNSPDVFISYILDLGWDIKNHKSQEIDRIDNNGNYEPNNIRLVDRATNCLNTRIQNNNKSGFVGVSKRNDKWRVNITINKKQIYLGIYSDIKDTIVSRNNYIKENNLIDYKIQ